jgi:hypothetical protein
MNAHPLLRLATRRSRSLVSPAALLLFAGAACLGATDEATAQCEPTSCAAAGASCGVLDDGCGGTLECGECGDGLTCGGDGVANVCAPGASEPEAPAPPAVPPAPRTLDQLAARGRELADADPLLAALRDEQPNNLGQRWGFEVGLGAAEGHTEHGPGKESRGRSLMAGQRAGYAIAVGFTIDRHRHAARAAIGASIAEVDPIVGELRNGRQGGVYYRLGFDVASAIFGPRSLGAQGNTQPGPGSLGIRDALGSREAQMGFEHSMALHLSRRYPQ